MALPHWHSSPFAAVPSPLAHEVPSAQVFDAEWHMSPVPGVHVASPQVHVPLLKAPWSVFAQAAHAVSLIWAEAIQRSRRERLSTQACPQSVWEKAEAM